MIGRVTGLFYAVSATGKIRGPFLRPAEAGEYVDVSRGDHLVQVETSDWTHMIRGEQ